MISALWSRLSSRDRRAIRLALCVLIPTLAYGYLVRPITTHLAAVRADISRESDLYQRELGLITSEPAYQQALAASGADLIAAAPHLFPGTDSITASAGFVSYVTGLAANHRIFIQRSTPLSPEIIAEGVLRLRTELRGVSDLYGIVSWLGILERTDKLVRVAELALSPARAVGRNRDEESRLVEIAIVLDGLALLADTDSTTSTAAP